MGIANNLIDGARLAFMVGFTLMLVNGAFARFSPSKRTLNEMVGSSVGGL